MRVAKRVECRFCLLSCTNLRPDCFACQSGILLRRRPVRLRNGARQAQIKKNLQHIKKSGCHCGQSVGYAGGKVWTIHPSTCSAASLEWQLPGADGPSSLFLLPSELATTQHPHAVKDHSRVSVFYGDHSVLFYAPGNRPFSDAVLACHLQGGFSLVNLPPEAARRILLCPGRRSLTRFAGLSYSGLSLRTEQEREFNLPALLARHLARAIHLPCVKELLRRTKPTTTQTHLKREARALNKRGTFAVRPGV
jgi:hypothetical protein